MPDNSGAGAQVSGDTFDHVDIQSFNPGSDALPSWVGSGGVYQNGTISGAGAGSIGTAVRVGPGSGTVAIEDSFIDHPTGAALSNSGATGTLTMRRSRVVTTGQTPVQASAGTTSVENSVIQTAGASGFYALASSSAGADINLDQVTAVNAGGNATAIVAQATAGKSGSSAVNVRDSILRGYAGAYLRQAPVASPDGNASVAIQYSNVPVTGAETSSGDGTVTLTPGNIDADPCSPRRATSRCSRDRPRSTPATRPGFSPRTSSRRRARSTATRSRRDPRPGRLRVPAARNGPDGPDGPDGPG